MPCTLRRCPGLKGRKHRRTHARCPPLPTNPPCLRSHVNGLALALLLGVDGVILPPAVSRRTFNTTLAHLRDETLWLPQPLGTLLDVRRMAAHWRERHSIQLHEVGGWVGGDVRS